MPEQIINIIKPLEVDSRLTDDNFNIAASVVCREHKVFSSNDYKDFPVVSVSRFKNEEIYHGDKVSTEFRSSGTTGRNVSIVRLQDTRNYDQVIEKEWKYFVNPTEEQNRIYLSLIPSSEEWKHSSLAYMFDKALFGEPIYRGVKNVTEDSFSIDTEVIIKAVHDAKKSDWPVVVYGTTYAMMWLTDWASDYELLPFPDGSIVVHTGGFKGKVREITLEELNRDIAWFLGIQNDHIITEYGMSELSSQMWTSNYRAYTQGLRSSGSWRDDTYQVPSWVRVRVVEEEDGELVDVKEGERGIIVVYDLANVWTSVAIKTEDIGSVVTKDGIQYLRVCGRAMTAEPKGCSLAAENALDK